MKPLRKPSRLRVPLVSKLESLPDLSTVLSVFQLHDVVEAVDDKCNGGACGEGCWESNASLLNEGFGLTSKHMVPKPLKDRAKDPRPDLYKLEVRDYIKER